MQPRPGNRTSEFWATFLVTVVVAVNAFLPEASKLAEIDDTTALIVTAGLWAVYNVVRGWVKRPAPRPAAPLR